MLFRQAETTDIPQLLLVYKTIIKRMNKEGIKIWNEYYPCEVLKDDVLKHQLYVLTNEEVIAAAFAICNSNAGEKMVKWRHSEGKAFYLDRLGVNVNFQGQGIASLMLKNALSFVKKAGAESLRMFVVDINKPAVNLYLKNGFSKADGIYNEFIDESLTLHEYGFEKSALL